MLKITARAKVNLTLDVLGNLPDGYHEVRTVMQLLDLCDILEISSGRSGITLSSDSKGIPIGPENLVYRAAQLLLARTGLEKKAHINIIKRIPVAAGLGGGSSNAAAALWGLNHFWELGFTPEELMEMGAEIGADVPFFLTAGTALGTGRGDKLTPLPSPPPMGVLLVKPYFGVSTAQVYKMFDTLSGVTGYSTDSMLQALEKRDVNAIAAHLGNDLEPVTASLYPEIRAIKKDLLDAGALGAEMSGSGPTVFALAENKEKARQLAANIKSNCGDILVSQFDCQPWN